MSINARLQIPIREQFPGNITECLGDVLGGLIGVEVSKNENTDISVGYNLTLDDLLNCRAEVVLASYRYEFSEPRIMAEITSQEIENDPISPALAKWKNGRH